jgi:hypothetical protein
VLLERQKLRPSRAAVAVAAAALVLVGIFAALAVSVVHVREPLDGRVGRSFRAVAPSLGGITTVASSRACVKTSVDWYYCDVEVRGRRAVSGGETVYYRMLLQDDGCWNAAVVRPASARESFPRLHGCVKRD